MSFPGIPSLDAAVMAFIQTHFHNTVTDTVFPIITSLGEAGIGWIVLSLVLLCFKKTRRTGGLVLIAMTVTLLFGELTLKNIICRLRPCNVFTDFPMLIARPTSYSFPSGHTSSSFAAALILTLRHKKVGWLAYIRQCSSRSPCIFLFVHYPTDVLAGILLGTLAALLTYFAAKADSKTNRQRSARHKFEPFISTDKSSAQVSQPTRFFYLCSVLSCQFFQHFPYIMRGVFLNLNDLCTGVLCYVPQVTRDGGVVRTADDKEHVAGL